jgi:phenylacetate-coenzyme A ligase PaaK-like adenylate-forming protein
MADPVEWTDILASYGRAYDWAGLEVGLSHPLRMAIVSSRAPSHQSSIVGATVRNPLVPTLRLDATDSLANTVSALTAFRPQALVGYASMLGILAVEQAAGRLAISPRAVFSASEVLTPDIRSAVTTSWGSQLFDVYAATETAGIASECQHHHVHRYEDLVIAEPVDAENRPVPPGVTGEKLLVTVLFSRTQPLIRYELTDRVRFSVETADDVGPFGLLDEVEGRTEEIITLPGARGGEVRIHPNVFHAVLDRADAPWQVISYPDRVHVLVAGPADVAQLRANLGRVLADLGAEPQAIEVERVTAIPRTPLGKAPLVRVA